MYVLCWSVSVGPLVLLVHVLADVLAGSVTVLVICWPASAFLLLSADYRVRPETHSAAAKGCCRPDNDPDSSGRDLGCRELVSEFLASLLRESSLFTAPHSLWQRRERGTVEGFVRHQL